MICTVDWGRGNTLGHDSIRVVVSVLWSRVTLLTVKGSICDSSCSRTRLSYSKPESHSAHCLSYFLHSSAHDLDERYTLWPRAEIAPALGRTCLTKHVIGEGISAA